MRMVTFDFDDTVVGPKHIGNAKEPIDIFNLFINQQFLTYWYSNDIIRKNGKSRKWKDVSLSEMKDFIAVVFNMGLITRNKICDN